MNGKYVPEDIYLQLYSEFRNLKEKTVQECKVVEVIMRKEGFDVALPILYFYNDPKSGTTVVVGQGSTWNNITEEPKNTKFITKLNHTDIEVLDSANGSRLVYRLEDGSWWMINGPDDPHVDRGSPK